MVHSHRIRSGFTMIEIMVVVGIISLLAALLIPSIGLARRNAGRVACASNLRIVGQALNYYKTSLGRYPLPGDRKPSLRRHEPYRCVSPASCRLNPCADRWNLANLGDIAESLVSIYLQRPESMFCPTSLRYDRLATKPFVRSLNGYLNPVWKTTGDISYIYLSGIRMPFTDAAGKATYDPTLESPDRAVNRSNPRVILAGDRCVERNPAMGKLPGSNHERFGGWFCYTTGDVVWRDWSTLAPHPDVKGHIWYWPRLSAPRN